MPPVFVGALLVISLYFMVVVTAGSASLVLLIVSLHLLPWPGLHLLVMGLETAAETALHFAPLAVAVDWYCLLEVVPDFALKEPGAVLAVAVQVYAAVVFLTALAAILLSLFLLLQTVQAQVRLVSSLFPFVV